MADYDYVNRDKRPGESMLDPRSLDFIDRISYFERLGPKRAGNDNAGSLASRNVQGSDCFNSWAVPDFIKSQPA